MKCRSVLTRVDALRTGELERADSEEVESHLGTCRSCHDSVEDIRAFAETVRSLLPAETSTDTLSAIRDGFDSFALDGRTVWVAFSRRGIRMIDLRAKSAAEFRESYFARFGRDACEMPLLSGWRDAIAAALRGESSGRPPVDLTALTDFERNVLEAITAIPRGEVRSYEWVARAVERPKAIRAVGNVMASNPVPFVLPCHRVVPTSGGIGNYGFGPEMKRSILEAEGTPVAELEELARKRVRYIGSRTTKIFCVPTCRDARRIRNENRVLFRDSSAAAEEGYRPCKHCTPVAA